MYQDLNTNLQQCKVIDLHKIIEDSLAQTCYQCDILGLNCDFSLKDVESLFYHNFIVGYVEAKKLYINEQTTFFFKKRLVDPMYIQYIGKIFKILKINSVNKPKNFIKKLKDFAKSYNLKYVEQSLLTDCTNKLALLK